MYAAAANPNPDVVKVLLDAGASPDLKSYEGFTAREYAQMNPNKDKVLSLLK